MAITKKLMKLGNSYGLIIERPILDLLGIDVDTLLEITTPDGVELVIKPVHKTTGIEFSQALEKVNKQFGPALRKLAEGPVKAQRRE